MNFIQTDLKMDDRIWSCLQFLNLVWDTRKLNEWKKTCEDAKHKNTFCFSNFLEDTKYLYQKIIGYGIISKQCLKLSYFTIIFLLSTEEMQSMASINSAIDAYNLILFRGLLRNLHFIDSMCVNQHHS